MQNVAEHVPAAPPPAAPPRREVAGAHEDRATSGENAPEPARASALMPVDLERSLLAFGNALQVSHERNGRDVLHTVLTAQHEQLAMLIQAIADQRLDYRDQLERSIQSYGEQLGRAARQLSDELNPEAILQIGELFRVSAGHITGALGRGERLTTVMIDKQSRLVDGLGTLTGQIAQLVAVVTELRDFRQGQGDATSPQRAPPPREPKQRLARVVGHPDVLAGIRDDLDAEDDDT